MGYINSIDVNVYPAKGLNDRRASHHITIEGNTRSKVSAVFSCIMPENTHETCEGGVNCGLNYTSSNFFYMMAESTQYSRI